MIYLKDFRQGKLIYEALDSDVRLAILEELLEHGELNLAYFAKKLNVSNGAITAHVKKLYAAGLIDVTTSSGVRGTQKLCCLAADKLIVNFTGGAQAEGRVESAQIEIGNYIGYDVRPTCGLATTEKMIGRFDDPACFSYPERTQAGILWLAEGYVEYLIPNYLTERSELMELQITMEIASEAPGYAARYPSDVLFSLNGNPLGSFLSKGEYNDRAGTCNPAWWYGNLGQYGKRVCVSVGEGGSFVNGVKTSSVTLSDLALRAGEKIVFRIAAPADVPHRGGFTLFGRGFGDYGEGIVCKFICKQEQI